MTHEPFGQDKRPQAEPQRQEKPMPPRRSNGASSAYIPIAQARRLFSTGTAAHPGQPTQTPDFTHNTHQCLCGAPRDAHSGPRHGGGHPGTDCRRYAYDDAYQLAYQAHQALTTTFREVVNTWQEAEYPRAKPRPGGWGVGPSDFGTCPKQIQFREKGLPEGFDPDDVNEMAAIIGQLIHDAAARALKYMFPWRLFEIEVYAPGLDRPGRIDSFDPITAICEDIKTCGEWAWEDLGDNGVRDSWRKQLLVYAYALTLMGHEVELLQITAIRRSNGDIEVFHFDYDEVAAKEALGELQALNSALDLGMSLPRAGSGPTADKICRDHCPFKSACWNIPAANKAGRSPESYTFLGDPVNIAEAAHAAEIVKGWRIAEAEAKREKDRTAPMLIGVPDGTYGDWQVKATSKPHPLYKTYFERVQEALARGATAEEIAQITVPSTKSTGIDIKKVRAANRDAPTPKEKP